MDELIGVIFVAFWCGVIGWKLSSASKKWWISGYLIGLLPLVMIGLSNYIAPLHFIPPFSWLAAGKNEFGFAGCGAVLMLSILACKTDRKFYKTALPAVMVLVFVFFCVNPFLEPLLLAKQHGSIKTRMVEDICMQTTDYTCGPAASVTALRKLGVEAGEGELAIACSTTQSSGTQPDLLENGITTLYSEQGVTAEYRLYSDIEDLKETDGIDVVVIDWWFFVKHYVTVLDVTDMEVVVADPYRGRKAYSHDGFEDIWCKRGVLISKK